jgi:hypothetical protein
LLDFLLAAAYSFAKVRIEEQNIAAKKTKLKVKNKQKTQESLLYCRAHPRFKL